MPMQLLPLPRKATIEMIWIPISGDSYVLWAWNNISESHHLLQFPMRGAEIWDRLWYSTRWRQRSREGSYLRPYPRWYHHKQYCGLVSRFYQGQLLRCQSATKVYQFIYHSLTNIKDKCWWPFIHVWICPCAIPPVLHPKVFVWRIHSIFVERAL